MPVHTAPDLETTLQRALVIAGRTGERHATTSHLLMALLEDVHVGWLFRACAIDAEPLRREAEKLIEASVPGAIVWPKSEPDRAMVEVMSRAAIQAKGAGRRFFGSPHVVLALLAQKDDAASALLSAAGVTRYDVARHIAHGIRKQPDVSIAATTATREPDTPVAVMLLNDDFTPMEFVVDVLRGEFGLPEADATQTMLQIHKTGSAACGVFPKTTALAKMAAVEKLAREHQHPLHCSLEQQEV